MRLSENGRKLIQGFEGLMLTAYPDADGFSIGYGHFGAKPGDRITREEADRLFIQDVVKFETAVSLTCPSATQNQFDAMTCLAYNIGTGAFAKSTTARLHNLGDYEGAANGFTLFNKSQGSVLAVLSNRRAKERNVYLNGYPAYSDSNITPVPSPAPAPKKGGFIQFLGIALSVGLGYGLYTRTNVFEGKLTMRKVPRALPTINWPIRKST